MGGGLAVIHCGSSLVRQPAAFVLSDESGESLQRLPRVARLHLTGVPNIDLDDYWWIEGDVSSTNAKKLRLRDIPDSVEKRRRPLTVWSQQNEIILAPAEPLEPGERYTLVALGVGTLASLEAAVEEQRLWSRWGNGAVQVGDEVPYCEWRTLPFIGHGSALAPDQDLAISFGGAAGEVDLWGEALEQAQRGLDAGFFDDSCVRLKVSANAHQAFVPPARVGDINLNPAPIPITTKREQDATIPSFGDTLSDDACTLVANATVCAEGPGFVIKAARAASALEFWLDGVLVGQVVRDETVLNPIMFGPVESGAEYELRGLAFSRDAQPQGEISTAKLRAGAPSPHFVLTEVMADPSGPEPQGEWVELVNLGTLAGSLLDYQLWDDAGGVSLPDVWLAPGQFGLIVRRDFVLDRALVPEANAVPIQVESLGKNGLRNSGEMVELRTPTGELQSSIPGISSPEGVSIARVSLWAPDTAESFQAHGEPGASPGRINSFAEKAR